MAERDSKRLDVQSVHSESELEKTEEFEKSQEKLQIQKQGKEIEKTLKKIRSDPSLTKKQNNQQTNKKSKKMGKMVSGSFEQDEKSNQQNKNIISKEEENILEEKLWEKKEKDDEEADKSGDQIQISNDSTQKEEIRVENQGGIKIDLQKHKEEEAEEKFDQEEEGILGTKRQRIQNQKQNSEKKSEEMYESTKNEKIPEEGDLEISIQSKKEEEIPSFQKKQNENKEPNGLNEAQKSQNHSPKSQIKPKEQESDHQKEQLDAESDKTDEVLENRNDDHELKIQNEIKESSSQNKDPEQNKILEVIAPKNEEIPNEPSNRTTEIQTFQSQIRQITEDYQEKEQQKSKLLEQAKKEIQEQLKKKEQLEEKIQEMKKQLEKINEDLTFSKLENERYEEEYFNLNSSILTYEIKIQSWQKDYQQLKKIHQDDQTLINALRQEQKIIKNQLQESLQKSQEIENQLNLKKQQLVDRNKQIDNLLNQAKDYQKVIQIKNSLILELNYKLKKSEITFKIEQQKMKMQIEENRSQYYYEIIQHQLQSAQTRYKFTEIPHYLQGVSKREVQLKKLKEENEMKKKQIEAFLVERGEMTDKLQKEKEVNNKLAEIMQEKDINWDTKYEKLKKCADSWKMKLDHYKAELQFEKIKFEKDLSNKKATINKLKQEKKDLAAQIYKYNKNVNLALQIHQKLEQMKIDDHKNARKEEEQEIPEKLEKGQFFCQILQKLHYLVLSWSQNQRKLMEQLEIQWKEIGHPLSMLNQYSVLGIIKQILQDKEKKLKEKDFYILEIDKSYQNIYASYMDDDSYHMFGYELMEKFHDAFKNRYQNKEKMDEMSVKIEKLQKSMLLKQKANKQLHEKLNTQKVLASEKQSCKKCEQKTKQLEKKEKIIKQYATDNYQQQQKIKQLGQAEKKRQGLQNTLAIMKRKIEGSEQNMQIERRQKNQELEELMRELNQQKIEIQELKNEKNHIESMITRLFEKLKDQKQGKIIKGTKEMIESIEKEIQKKMDLQNNIQQCRIQLQKMEQKNIKKEEVLRNTEKELTKALEKQNRIQKQEKIIANKNKKQQVFEERAYFQQKEEEQIIQNLEIRRKEEIPKQYLQEKKEVSNSQVIIQEEQYLCSQLSICPQKSKAQISEKLTQYYYNFNTKQQNKQPKLRFLCKSTENLEQIVSELKKQLKNIVIFCKISEDHSFCIFLKQKSSSQAYTREPCIFFSLNENIEQYPKNLSNPGKNLTFRVDQIGRLCFGSSEIVISSSKKIQCFCRSSGYYLFPKASIVNGENTGVAKVEAMEVYEMYVE